MRWCKGDVVHIKNCDHTDIGVIIDVDFKKKRYAVMIDTKTEETLWFDADEVF